MSLLKLTTALLAGAMLTAVPALAAHAWDNKTLLPEQRAALALKAMNQNEKFTLVFGYFGSFMRDKNEPAPAEARMGSAGYVPGVPRLNIPPQWVTDAGLGVASQRESEDAYRERTALPAGIAVAASFNPELAYKGGVMIGSEAHASGFNVMLGGGVNLLREPRNGRNFEFGGEDPLLAGTMAGASIAGVQSQNVISTIKHWALNDQETGRHFFSAELDDGQAHQSDFLAFQIGIELGKPGSVMCSYNRVRSFYACESDYLLNQVLKREFKYPGYVMSDWGAVYSTVKAANAGLDQQSAYVFDEKPYFGKMLRDAVKAKKVPQARLDDMAKRILYAMFSTGVYDNPVTPKKIDLDANKAVSRAAAEEGIVLLKNRNNVLPLAATAKRILIIGGYADRAVISGGGSSTVMPAGGNPVPGLGPKGFPGPIIYLPDAPMAAIQARAPMTPIRYIDGTDPVLAAKEAAKADVVIVFGTQWSGEDIDHSMNLDGNQDEVIKAAAAANPNTIVVLETGNPVLMPWADSVGGIVEAWFPGSGGGEAIARVLFGEVDASGRLPATFPASLEQLPHPKIAGSDLPERTYFNVEYTEGAAVGYKWFEKNNLKPLYPFGYGLSYTSFAYSGLSAAVVDGKLTVRFTVQNTGARDGKDAPQVYVAAKNGGWEAPKRLAGFKKVALKAGASTEVTLSVDPRLLSTHDGKGWTLTDGPFVISLGASSADIKAQVEVNGKITPFR